MVLFLSLQTTNMDHQKNHRKNACIAEPNEVDFLPEAVLNAIPTSKTSWNWSGVDWSKTIGFQQVHPAKTIKNLTKVELKKVKSLMGECAT
jgi:hypothetical protein